MVSDEPLCWSGKSTIEHQAQRQEIKALVTLASQLAFQLWVGPFISQLLGFFPFKFRTFYLFVDRGLLELFRGIC